MMIEKIEIRKTPSLIATNASQIISLIAQFAVDFFGASGNIQ